MKVLFFLPHPDDESILCPLTLYQLVQRGYEVTLVLSTQDEYGTEEVPFKGVRIRRIRMSEMYSAARAYGVDEKGRFKFRIMWLGYIDGHLPVTREARDRVLSIVSSEKPDVVISTDRWYPMDFHNDHINIGILTILALRKIPADQRPPLFVVQSSNPDHYQPFSSRDARIAWKAFGRHRSQITPLAEKLLNFGRWWFFNVFRRIRAGRPAEAFRKVDVDRLPEEHHPMSLWQHVKYVFFRHSGTPGGSRYLPSPSELGLNPLPVVIKDPF